MTYASQSDLVERYGEPMLTHAPRLKPSSSARWPREVVVEHSDGTVSLFADVAVVDGIIRSRRVDDRFREESIQ